MLRLFAFFLLCAGLSAPALACDMQTEARDDVLVKYVQSGKTCLESPPAEFRFDADVELLFINKINTERSKRGLRTLSVRRDMLPAARFHSLDMGVNEYFGHESPLGRTHAYRLSAYDRTLLAKGSAENIAQFGPAICLDQDGIEVPCSLAPGFKPPSRTLVANDLHHKLMNSPGHRRNILDPAMTHMAVGVARTETGFYVTQLFAAYAGQLSRPAPIQLEAGSRFEMTASVPGWTVTNLALSVTDEPTDLKAGQIPSSLYGDMSLRVRAENVIDRVSGNKGTRVVEWIYPTGPGITVKPATGS